MEYTIEHFLIRSLCDSIPHMEPPIGELVVGWLDAAGMTASTIARRAGVSSSTLHRVINGKVDPSVGTLREIAIACGNQLHLTTDPLSEPMAAAAARSLLEEGYVPPADLEVTLWHDRLLRLAGSDDPIDLVTAAAKASSPLHRRQAIAFTGPETLLRLASAGDASRRQWVISGPSGLALQGGSKATPVTTILWCEDPLRVSHMLTDSKLTVTQRRDRATVIVIDAEPELFFGSFQLGPLRYAAPIQIVIDCVAQGGAVAERAILEARSW